MSIAARRSHQGDEFQAQVAAHWLVRLLEPGSDIEYVQVDPLALVEDPQPVRVDDVVVRYRDGALRFIQAKKNQPNYRAWSISDLGDELVKAREQHEKYPDASIEFCSGTPFGELRKLAEESAHFPTLAAFEAQAAASLREPLEKLAKLAKCSTPVAFSLARRLTFGHALDVDQWEQDNRERLRRTVSSADDALDVLIGLVRKHQSSLRGAQVVLRRQELVRALEARQVFLAPDVNVLDASEALARASRIGRSWLRTIADERIGRPELEELMAVVLQPDSKSVLLVDGPGTGKTCVLLELADRLEATGTASLLFLRGDEYAACTSVPALEEKGLPPDIVGLVARVARERRVIVILDSLDVLSLNREHGALTLLLGLLDRLLAIPNVVVVAACRAFDIQFDPQLRARAWSKRVSLHPLDFETTVRPLLERHGVDSGSWSPELRTLATNPQNLRLLTELGAAKLSPDSVDIRSAHQLHARYLEEVVSRNTRLGEAGMRVLEALAHRMFTGRQLRVPSVSLEADREQVRRLVSEGVLHETRLGAVQFSHQTLLDAVAIRAALRAGKGLLEFVRSLPPFPFVRPAVRAFVAHLRVLQPELFERQLRSTLDSPDVAYHLKRAIVECVSEVVPTTADGSLIRFLWRSHPELFQRCLVRMERAEWFPVLLQEWVPLLSGTEQDVGLRYAFLGLIARWANTYPAEVIGLWREAIERSGAPRHLGLHLARGLDRFTNWSTPGVRALVAALVADDREEYGASGAVLSRYVEATGDGDDLLWEYVTRLLSEESDSTDLDKLRCEGHHFHCAEFFSDRLNVSDTLLSRAINAICGWAVAEQDYELLHATSWTSIHQSGFTARQSPLSTLVSGVEEALRLRARHRTPWWLEHEASLRAVSASSIRYMLVRAYSTDLENHRESISSFLLERDLLQDRELVHEVGELIRAAFPHLTERVQEAHELVALSLYDDVEPARSAWVEQAKCALLSRIPAPLRSRAVQVHLDRWGARQGNPSSPRIYRSAGWVSPPVSDEALLGLSAASLWRLVEFYERSPAGEHWHDHTGGLEHLCSEITKAASRAPRRFLGLLEEARRAKRDPAILAAMLRGLGEHLRHRHGVLQRPRELKPDESPLPDLVELTRALVEVLESCSLLWRDASSVAEVLQGAAECTNDEAMAERIAWLLVRLFHGEWPSEREERDSAGEVMFDALNTTHGVAAISAATLAANLLERGHSLPFLLRWLLVRCSADRRPSVPAGLLDRLPFIIHKDAELGWRLLSNVCADASPALWALVERSLYYEIRGSFERVRPLLDRVRREASEECGEMWGRLSMLAVLHEKLPMSGVFAVLVAAKSEAMWKGVVQVLLANAGAAESASQCKEGLLVVLRDAGITPSVLKAVDQGLFSSEGRADVGFEVVTAFLDAVTPAINFSELHGVFRWLAEASRRDARQALVVIEKITAKLTPEDAARVYDEDALAPSLLEVLREADQSDDPELTTRASADGQNRPVMDG